MYPNPQDVLPLPPRPDLGQYRKRAKDLVAACKSRPDDVRAWAERWIADLVAAQSAGAQESIRRDAERHASQVDEFARRRLGDTCALNQAQFVIARAHGFDSWTRLVEHVEALTHRSQTAAFEAAADAIINGDLAALRALLDADPGLIRARSTREHQATLLHYVAANGVENYRQRTPANIVTIATELLDRGAEVDAECDVYGGGATTLGLVVTSAHPRAMGVQNGLADLLIDRGARIGKGMVHSCLMNGCPEAGAHLYQRGAAIDFGDAVGIGEAEIVRAHLRGERPRATPDELREAMIMAAWYDRGEIIDLLVKHGVPVDARGRDGDTALHIAAYQGQADLVDQLLSRGAGVNLRDDKYGTTPLVWALHAWLVEHRPKAPAYRSILLALVTGGAEVRADWIDDDRVRADPELHRALAARIGP